MDDAVLLRLALDAGLVTGEDLKAIEPDRPKLQALVDSGRITSEQLGSLLQGAGGDETLVPGSSPLSESDRQASGRSEDLPPWLKGWDRYRIDGRLGRGGMGEVFGGWDPRLGRRVALKFLHGTDPRLVERFLGEARLQARVNHPGVCRVYEVGHVGEHPYIAMQEVSGATLDRVAAEMTVDQKVRLMVEVTDAVHAAHRTGLIHRDLKPGNILVDRSEDGAFRPYVVDFGLARDQAAARGLTIPGSVYGTPGYMSPEQLGGRRDQLDRRTDVYSMGAVLYEILAGAPHLEFQNFAEAILKLREEDAIPLRKLAPAIPADLETVVMKCLEKDPGRRYESARALGDDLRRYLDGEPIEARPTARLYRMRKRIQKNPAIWGAGFLAVILVAVFGFVAVHARWQSDRRSELAQRFAAEVREMESVYRLAELLPPHDMSRYRSTLHQRMTSIETEMNDLGEIARGPGLYALGRGALNLGEYERARDYLEAAWARGEKTPEVSYALGQALGHLYQQALEDLGRIDDPALRESTREQIRKRYRDQARSHLREAVGTTLENPALIEAQLAFYDERYDDALEASRRAWGSVPWLFEAKQMEGMVLLAKARSAAEHGEDDQAGALLNQSGLAYRQALAIGRSSAALYVAECARRKTGIYVVGATRPLQAEEVEQAVVPCDQAIRIDHQLSRPWAEKGQIYAYWAEDLFRTGKDPSVAVTRTIESARQALRYNPRGAGAWTSEGTALHVRARWKMMRGEDPEPDLVGSVAALEKAVAIDPGLPSVQNSMGNVNIIRARYELSQGMDPIPAAHAAIASYEKALSLSPKYFIAHINLGTARTLIAETMINRGEDPAALLEAAAGDYDLALKANPNHAASWNNRGNVYLTLGDDQLARGIDASEALHKAVASYQRALEIRPEYTFAPWNIAYAQRGLGLDALRRGEDPTPALAAAREALRRAERLNPSDPDNWMEEARVAVVEARWRVERGESPDAALEIAEKAIDRGFQLNRDHAGLWAALAESCRWRMAGLRQQGRPALLTGRRGIEAASRALQLVNDDARTLAIRGALEMLTAAEISGPDAASLRRRGVSDLQAAFRKNANLRREFDQLLQPGAGDGP